MKRVFLPVTLLCAILVAVPASADVIYDNGTYTPGGISAYSDYSAGDVSADNFVLQPGSATITDIHWWGVYGDNQLVPDAFTVQIFGDNGGLPDTSNVLLDLSAGDVAQTDTGDVNNLNENIYAYSLNIAPLTLTAGQTYYLAIANNTGLWRWMTSTYGTRFLDNSTPLGDAYTQYSDYNLAFNLTNDGVVPEPASMTLLGIGLGGLAVRARRKKRS